DWAGGRDVTTARCSQRSTADFFPVLRACASAGSRQTALHGVADLTAVDGDAREACQYGLHDAAHVLRSRRTGLGDGVLDGGGDRRLVGGRRKIGREQRDLRLVLGREVVSAAGAEL